MNSLHLTAFYLPEDSGVSGTASLPSTCFTGGNDSLGGGSWLETTEVILSTCVPRSKTTSVSEMKCDQANSLFLNIIYGVYVVCVHVYGCGCVDQRTLLSLLSLFTMGSSDGAQARDQTQIIRFVRQVPLPTQLSCQCKC